MGMDVYGRKPTKPEGDYFRASIWAWRPICDLMRKAGVTVPHTWALNDGDGPTTQAACNKIADALEAYLKANPETFYSKESDVRVDHNGRFLLDGRGGMTAYRVQIDHLREFIRFLRACGGFKIC